MLAFRPGKGVLVGVNAVVHVDVVNGAIAARQRCQAANSYLRKPLRVEVAPIDPLQAERLHNFIAEQRLEAFLPLSAEQEVGLAAESEGVDEVGREDVSVRDDRLRVIARL